MDAEKRIQLIAKVNQICDPNAPGPIPVVSLEDFFIGNDDMGSLGCNLLDHPGINHFYEIFNKLESQENVYQVLVGIMEIEEDHPEMWPFSERVYVITSASIEELSNSVQTLQVDEIAEETEFELLPSPQIPNGYKNYCLWWD